jgi:hypothetical protein
MSDNFIPVPLPGDIVLEQAVQEIEIQPVLEGIQPEDSRPRGEDYIPERIQYIKRFKELSSVPYAPVSDMINLLLRDLDNYSRGEISLDEIKNICPEYYVEHDNENFPNREYLIPYNHIRSRLISLYEQEFGDN